MPTVFCKNPSPHHCHSSPFTRVQQTLDSERQQRATAESAHETAVARIQQLMAEVARLETSLEDLSVIQNAAGDAHSRQKIQYIVKLRQENDTLRAVREGEGEGVDRGGDSRLRRCQEQDVVCSK